MKLEELDVYLMAMDLADKVWSEVKDWDYFLKSTIGKQLVNAVDSIAANISEGYGRYHYKENKQFIYYARGSLSETKTWVQKAFNRGLIEESVFKDLYHKLERTSVKLNNYLHTIGKKSPE